MKAKRLISFSFATILLCSSLCGCGDDGKSKSSINEDSQNSFANEDNAMEIPDNSESAGGGDSISTEPTTEPLLMHIDDAREYSSGVAWVKSGTKWNIVDTSGTVKNSFSENYTIVTDFEGGFSIIDPDATIYMDGRIETSAQAIVIDTNGDTVLDLQSAGYSGFKNYDGLAEGSVILEKNIDTFEKSGDFFFHYDLNNGAEMEICSEWEENDINGFRYIDNGFYVRRLYYGDENKLPNEILCFHNYLTGQTISFRDDQVIKSVFDNNSEYVDWAVNRIGDFIFARVSVKGMRIKGFVFNLDSMSCESIPMNDFAQVNVALGSGYYGNYSRADIWGNLANIHVYDDLYDSEDYFYDFDAKKYTQFSPNCDYECKIIDYNNGNFLVTTENENDTVFYTIIDWNMNPVFSPKRYKDTTTLFDDYLISDEDDGSVSITRISSMSTIKNISNSTVVYVDKTSKCVWINNNQETTECYNIQTGELLFSISGICDIHSDFNDGLALIVNNTLDEEIIYVDTAGEQLKILDNSI